MVGAPLAAEVRTESVRLELVVPCQGLPEVCGLAPHEQVVFVHDLLFAQLSVLTHNRVQRQTEGSLIKMKLLNGENTLFRTFHNSLFK